MGRKNKGKDKNKKKLFRGLMYRKGDDFCTINNHNTSYGNERKKMYIINTLKAEGITKILTKHYEGKPIFVTLNTYFGIL